MKAYCKIPALLCLLLLVFTSCEKEENLVEEEIVTVNESSSRSEEIVKIVHNYEYYKEKFSVVYVLDTKENEVLETAGDIEIAEKIFGREDAPKGLLFTAPEKGVEETEIAIKVFDTTEEVDEYTATIAKGFEEALNGKGSDDKAKGDCYDLNYQGYGNFYFYYHSGYGTEMTGIRRTGKYFYQDWTLGAYNDQMTSLIATKPYGRQSYVRLFEHSCYGGKTFNFYIPYYYTAAGIPNLSYYTLSGWWFWRKSWNDKASSYKVWSW